MADRTSTVRVNVITDASGAGASLGKFGRVAGLAALGVGALGVGAALGANKLYAFGDAADDLNVSIAQGLKTMKLFGKQTEEVTQRVIDQAEAISRATAVDLNSIKATQAKLLTFKELAKSADEVGGNFDRATLAAIDLAAKGFGTAETNAVQLGKALNDPVKGLTALSRAGITFTDQEKERIATLVESNKMGQAQAEVLKAIETQVGGTAEATAGGFEKMKNSLAIFTQELALKALPALDAFGTFMLETGGPALERFGRAFADTVLPVLRQFGDFLIERAIPAVQRLGASFEENALPVLRRFGAFVRDTAIPALQEFSAWILEHVVPVLQDHLAKGLDRARDLFDQVRAAVQRNRPELEDMADKFKKVATFVVDKLGPVLADLATVGLPVLGAAITVAIEVISGLYQAWKSIYDIVSSVIGKIQDLIDKIQSIPSIPGGGLLGALAGSGRISTGSALGALAGTGLPPKGPESARAVTVNVEVNGFVGNQLELAQQIEAVLSANRARFGAA